MTAAAVTGKIGAGLELSAALQADDGTPLDLAGATLRATLRDALLAPLLNFTVTPAAAVGAVILALSAEQTAALQPGTYFADALIQLPSAAVISETFPVVMLPAMTQADAP